MADVTPQHQQLYMASCRPLVIDPGIAPLISHLKLAPGFRLWCIAHDISTRLHAGSGVVSVDELYAALPAYGVSYGARQFQNILFDEAHGLFWHRRENRPGVLVIRLAAYKRVWPKLLSRVDPNLAADFRPQQRVLVSAAGDVAEFKARLYAAWIETRNKSGAITMSRALLCKLWDVVPNTLLAWEESAGIAKTENRAQYGGDNPNVPPPHSYPYAGKDGKVHSAWQLPNTYRNSQTLRTNPHRGQAHKARRAIRRVLRKLKFTSSASVDQSQRADLCGVETRGAPARTGRLYFENDDMNKAAKACRKHVQKHGDLLTNHFTRLGNMVTRRRGSITIWECFDVEKGFLLTEVDDRSRPGQQTTVYQEMVKLAQSVGAAISGIRWKQTAPTLCVSTHTRLQVSQPVRTSAAQPSKKWEKIASRTRSATPLPSVMASGASDIVRAHRCRIQLTQQQQVKHGRKLSLKRIARLLQMVEIGQLDIVEQALFGLKA